MIAQTRPSSGTKKCFVATATMGYSAGWCSTPMAAQRSDSLLSLCSGAGALADELGSPQTPLPGQDSSSLLQLHEVMTKEMAMHRDIMICSEKLGVPAFMKPRCNIVTVVRQHAEHPARQFGMPIGTADNGRLEEKHISQNSAEG
jgi:hypothetical protein